MKYIGFYQVALLPSGLILTLDHQVNRNIKLYDGIINFESINCTKNLLSDYLFMNYNLQKLTIDFRN